MPVFSGASINVHTRHQAQEKHANVTTREKYHVCEHKASSLRTYRTSKSEELQITDNTVSTTNSSLAMKQHKQTGISTNCGHKPLNSIWPHSVQVGAFATRITAHVISSCACKASIESYAMHLMKETFAQAF